MEANKHDWEIIKFFNNLLNDESKNEFIVKFVVAFKLAKL